MPEGPTIRVTADQLRVALEGKRINRFTSRFKKAVEEEWEPKIEGSTVEKVRTHGKNIFFDLTSGWTLYTHMLMWGAWHVYTHGEPWRKEARKARVVLETDNNVLVLFSAPVCQLIHASALSEHQTSLLGPDLLKPDFNLVDETEIRRRLSARNEISLGEAIMDQTIMAGIGNILKSEILFAARLNPLRTVASLSAIELARLLAVSKDFMDRSYETRGFREVFLPPDLQRATGRLGYVYQRRGQHCLRCGEKIIMVRQGPMERLTFYCPFCQPRDPAQPVLSNSSAQIGQENLTLSPRRVGNLAEARDFVLDVNICVVFTADKRKTDKIPALWDVVVVPEADGPDWGARLSFVVNLQHNLPLAYPQEIFLGKLKGDRDVLTSMSKLAELYKKQHKPVFACSPLAQRLYAIIEQGPLTTYSLRDAAHIYGRSQRALFARALVELQISFNIVRTNQPDLAGDAWVPFSRQYPQFISIAA